MGWLALTRGDIDDDQVPELLVRPGHQVSQAGLLGRFPECDSQRVALPRVAVAANLQPGLLALVPAQQHPSRFLVHDQRGACHVQRQLTPPWISNGLAKGPYPS